MGQMVMDEREGDWQRGEGWQRGGEFLMTLAGVYQERHGGVDGLGAHILVWRPGSTQFFFIAA